MARSVPVRGRDLERYNVSLKTANQRSLLLAHVTNTVAIEVNLSGIVSKDADITRVTHTVAVRIL